MKYIDDLNLTSNFRKLWLLHRWTVVVIVYVLIIWLTTPENWAHTDTYFKAVILRKLSIVFVPIFILWMLIDFLNRKPITINFTKQKFFHGVKVINLQQVNLITIVEKPVMRSVEIEFSKNGYRVAKIPAWFVDDVTITSLTLYHYAKQSGKSFNISRKRISPIKGSTF
ncbi:hypothetical protein [Pseudoalteromonas gelatinilytica]